MKNPQPINLSTDEYFSSLGWAAVSRDMDGHALGCHGPFGNEQERLEYIASEADRQCSVTLLAHNAARVEAE